MSPVSTIPEWVPPLDTGKPSAGAINKVAPARRVGNTATNRPIRTVYGRDRLSGEILTLYQSEATGVLYVAYAFCRGPIDAFEKVFVDGVDVTDAEEGFDTRVGTERNEYLGDQTTPDPLLANAYSADGNSYADVNGGVAFLVLKIPPGTTTGFPRVEAVIRGLKLYDPRFDSTSGVVGASGTHRLDDPYTWTWSEVPALACSDFMYQRVGWGLDWQSVADLADHNEEQVGGVSRRTIGLTMDQPAPAEDWVQAFRAYMGAFIAWEKGVIRLIPERADVRVPYKACFPATSGAGNRSVIWGIGSDLDILDNAETVVELAFDWQGEADPGAEIVLMTTRGTLEFPGQSGLSFGHVARNQNGVLVSISDGTTEVPLLSDRTDLMDREVHLLSVRIDRVNDVMELFIDGVKQDTTADISGLVAGTIPHSLANVALGVNQAKTLETAWNGCLDEFRWWRGPRTDAEISERSNREVDSSEWSSMAVYTRFTEGVGTWAEDDSGNDLDMSLGEDVTWVKNEGEILAANVAWHFTADDIADLRLSRRSLRNDPTVVQVEYTDASGPGWPVARQEASAPGVNSGTLTRRASKIRLPGVHNASQARREAIERVNWFLSDLEATATVFDEGFQLQQGSVVAVTHPIGLTKKLFRLRRATSRHGYWTLDLVEYDPAIYSDAVISDPTFPDTKLLSPLRAPQALNLSAQEELFRTKQGTYSSRVRVSWTAPNSPYVVDYRIEGYVEGTLVMSGVTTQTEFVSPAVEELVNESAVDYEVKVFARTSIATSEARTVTTEILGKLAVPGDVPSITNTRVGADAYQITWAEAVDLDIFRYKVRIGEDADTWETASDLELVDGLTYVVERLQVGTHRVFVKAIDSVRNESENATSTQLVVALPEPPTGLTGFEIGGEVRLRWTASASEYVTRYRITYDGPAGGSELTLDMADSLRFFTKDVPEGTWLFRVYAVDGAQVESSTAASLEVEVTSDAGTFVAEEYNFQSPTVSNMHGWVLRRTGDDAYYVTNMDDAFGDTDFSDHETEPLAAYHSSGVSEFLTETHDFGALVNGTFIATVPVQALSGTVTRQIELSADGVSWDVFTSLSTRGQYRYARVRITTASTSTAFVVTQDVKVQVNVVPIEETGTVLTLTSGGKTVVLDRKYGAVAEISLTIQSTTSASVVYDNIILSDPNHGNVTTFEVYAFDSFTQQIAVNVDYKFKGV